jgi:hypothetical protein
MSNHVVEWAPFRLKAEIDEGQLLQVSEVLQTQFLNEQAGFLRRELFKGTEGHFVDVIWWSSRKAAQEALANAATNEVCGRYFQLMQNHGKGGAGVSHYLLFKTY